jgi:hypothetical protein
MDDRTRDGATDSDHGPGAEVDNDRSAGDAEDLDLEGHSATIYRRRRGPYPLRHGAPLPDADDRTRGERQPPGGRSVR